MRRLIGAVAALAAVATAAWMYVTRERGVASSGNGHSADAERVEMLRERIAAARRRLRDEFDSVRGE
jgi:hypothetical protein